MKHLGIIGGGQLGKMIAEAAHTLEFPVSVSVYDASVRACARITADRFTCGAFDDSSSVTQFADGLDIVTYEFENISPGVIRCLDNAIQGEKALRILQDRAYEKDFITSLGTIPCVPHAPVSDRNFCFPYPYIVKTRTLGYDGKGQALIRGENDLSQVKPGMIAEKYLEDITEYSLILARSASGRITHYPPIKNVHINQILDTSEFATVDAEAEQRMLETGIAIAEALQYCGVLTVEFFCSDGELYVNEVAPRVHNSGHITLDGASVSQFTLHLLALFDLPFPPVTVDRSWCMVNVLGQHYEHIRNREEELPGHFYDYGKHSTQHNRKVGHINGPVRLIETLKEARY